MDNVFVPGTITTLLSGPAGSTGKGTLAARLLEFYSGSGYVDIVCNTFSTQASHTVVEDDGTEHVYKHLNSCAHMPDRYGKMYIGHGAAISLPVLMEEISKYNMTPDKLGIDNLCVIIQDLDKGYEKGDNGFDGEEVAPELIRSGTTASGVGAALARKVLRRPNVLLAKDVPELQPYLCNVGEEIVNALSVGQTALLEIAQGYQLNISGYCGDEPFFPYCTSRNSTPVRGFDDLNVPAYYMGNVVIDYRTFPIRIHNNRYISTEDVQVDLVPENDHKSISKYHPDHFRFEEVEMNMDGEDHPAIRVVRPAGSNLYWDEIHDDKFAGKFEVFEANSGPNYPDSEELSWEELREMCGADRDMTQITTLTKLPRRVSTFSAMNFVESVNGCRPPDPYRVYVSINFMNWVDWSVTGTNSIGDLLNSKKVVDWWYANMIPSMKPVMDFTKVLIIGTGPKHSQFVNGGNL